MYMVITTTIIARNHIGSLFILLLIFFVSCTLLDLCDHFHLGYLYLFFYLTLVLGHQVVVDDDNVDKIVLRLINTMKSA